MSMDSYFYKVRSCHPKILKNVGRVLFNANCISPERTMTLSQIRAGYMALTEEKFPSMGDPRVELCFLLSTPYIACFSNEHGTFHFYLIIRQEEEES